MLGGLSIQRLSEKLGALRLMCLLCAAALACAGCGARRVDPGVDKVHSSVEPAAYVGPCPTALQTTANITGTPGLSVTYRFIGYGFPWGPMRRGIIPRSGTLQVRETASIDAAHAGYFFRQVWIIVQGYRLDKYSNRALYIVTCGVPPRQKQVSWHVNTPMYLGACPKMVSFAGSISAEPGMRVQYRIIGNGAAWGPVRRAVIGISGTRTVSENLSVDAAHAGYFYRQLWVIGHYPERDVYSERALYFVACLPRPHVNFTLFDISAPTQFTNTSNPKVCGDHVEPLRAGMLCGVTLANGELVVVWSWKPDGCPSRPCRPRVDGYRVYQTLGKSRRLILTQSDAALTIASFKQETSGLTGNCYAVRAFAGNDESSDSNEFCVTPGFGERVRHVVMRTTQVIPLEAGSAAVRFDLPQTLSGAAVWKAKLQFGSASAKNHRPRTFCVPAVAMATAAGGNHSGAPLPTDPYLGVLEDTNRIDVTSAVRAWAQGMYPNYGFIIRPADQHAALYHRACLTLDRDPALAVEYLNL